MAQFHLYNSTQLPTVLLRKLIRYAMKRAECRRDITLYIRPSYYKFHGVAQSAAWTLPRYYGFPKMRGRKITDTGFIQIWIPRVFPPWRDDTTDYALAIYSMLVHECKHVADLQQGRPWDSHRKRWKNRSHERRAEITCTLARKAAERCEDEKLTEYITDLALVLEEQRQHDWPHLALVAAKDESQEDK